MRQPHPREDLTGVVLAQYRALVGLPVEPEPVTGYVTEPIDHGGMRVRPMGVEDAEAQRARVMAASGEASHEARLAERYVTRAHANAFVAEFSRSLQPEG